MQWTCSRTRFWMSLLTSLVCLKVVCVCARARTFTYLFIFFLQLNKFENLLYFLFWYFLSVPFASLLTVLFHDTSYFFFLREKDLSACVFCFLSWGDWYDRCSWKRTPSSRPHTSCQGCPSLPLFVTCAKVGACRLPCRPDTWSFDT